METNLYCMISHLISQGFILNNITEATLYRVFIMVNACLKVNGVISEIAICLFECPEWIRHTLPLFYFFVLFWFLLKKLILLNWWKVTVDIHNVTKYYIYYITFWNILRKNMKEETSFKDIIKILLTLNFWMVV